MYTITKEGLMVHLPKELDHHIADGIRKEVDRRIVQNGITAVVFDFEETDFMDSSGIGLLMGRYKMVNYVGGTVYAIHLNDKLKKLLQLANVQQYVHIQTLEKP